VLQAQAFKGGVWGHASPVNVSDLTLENAISVFLTPERRL